MGPLTTLRRLRRVKLWCVAHGKGNKGFVCGVGVEGCGGMDIRDEQGNNNQNVLQHTRAHIHTHTRSHTAHTHMYAYTLKLTQTHMHIYTLTCTHT